MDDFSVLSIHSHCCSASETDLGPLGGIVRRKGCVSPAKIIVSMNTISTLLLDPGIVKAYVYIHGMFCTEYQSYAHNTLYESNIFFVETSMATVGLMQSQSFATRAVGQLIDVDWVDRFGASKCSQCLNF